MGIFPNTFTGTIAIIFYGTNIVLNNGRRYQCSSGVGHIVKEGEKYKFTTEWLSNTIIEAEHIPKGK